MLRGLLIRFLTVLALPMALLYPFGGLLFYLWLSHARPNDFVWSQYRFDNAAFYTAIATLIGYLAFEMRRAPLRWRGLKLLTVFWLLIALSTVFAIDPSLALPKLQQYTEIFIITFLIAAMARTEKRIGIVLFVIGGSVGLLGIKAGFDTLITGFQYQMHGPGGIMADENDFALALNMAIPILFGLASLEERQWLRRLLQCSAIGCAITIVATHSRSGFLGLCTGAFLLTLYSRRKVVGIAVLAVAVLAFVKYAPTAAVKRYESIPTAAENDDSAIGRLQAWETGWNMVKAHPILGVGPLNFELAFPHYSNYPVRAPHNAFIALLAESGVPSCLVFTAFILSTIAQMWWLRYKLRRDPENLKLATYCLILHITFIVYIVPNMFINRQNQDMMYHLLGVASAVAFVARHKLAEQRARAREKMRQRLTPELEPVEA